MRLEGKDVPNNKNSYNNAAWTNRMRCAVSTRGFGDVVVRQACLLHCEAVQYHYCPNWQKKKAVVQRP